MKKIKILLTFDYELPLGGASDYQKALFDPARQLLALGKELAVPVVLFADICSAIRFKEWNHAGYYAPFRAQLQDALKMGNDVQLHIHPHWMSTRYEHGAYIPSLDYSLSSFKEGVAGYSIEGIIEEAFKELTAICCDVKPDYRCGAFRAGGYDVGSEAGRILNKLYDLGIRLESSVIQGFRLDYRFSRVDYTATPSASRWFVSKEGPLTKAAPAGLLELPISSRPVNLLDVMARRIRKIVNRKKYRARLYRNSGMGMAAFDGDQSLKSKYRSVVNPGVLTLDRENIEYSDLEKIVAYNVNKYKHETDDLILTLIAHPKSMGTYHRSLMKDFVNKIRLKYGPDLEFVTYSDLIGELV